MQIAILGTRGIPNRYGGFEQFAEQLAPALVGCGYSVFVYCTHHHPYEGNEFAGVRLIRCFDPEPQIGAAGQFVYDLNCVLDARSRNFDLIYQLGYTTSGIWQWLMPRGPVLVSNMDGLEWSRSKYPAAIKALLRWSERAVVRRSHFTVADAVPIQQYLNDTYAANAVYLAYSAALFENPDVQLLKQIGVEPRQYLLLIARLQPDNHVEMVIQGTLASGTTLPLLIIGDTHNKHGQLLRKKYESAQIRFIGGLFDRELLDNLRHFAAFYFHGHSAGGTNPSLLEAMSAGARIIAHNNIFNKDVLDQGAAYFSSAADVTAILQSEVSEATWENKVNLNRSTILRRYDPESLMTAYILFFKNCLTPK